MLKCPTNTCKGEAKPSTALTVNQTYNISADSRCVYTVKDASWIQPTNDMKFIVSNQNLSNTMTSFASVNLTYLKSPTKLQPGQFVMVINTALTADKFITYDDPVEIPKEVTSGSVRMIISSLISVLTLSLITLLI